MQGPGFRHFCFQLVRLRSLFTKADTAGTIVSVRNTRQTGHQTDTTMAKTSTKVRSSRPPKFKSRVVRRCFKCGRKRSYMRDFDLCRQCFRELASEGMIPGIKKSSW